MKLKITSILFCILIITSCKEKDANFEIDIKSHEANNLVIKILHETDNGLEIVDSTKLEMSRAQLRGNLSKPEMMYIYVDNAQDYLPVFVEPGELSIDLNYCKLNKSIVKGSESNKILIDFFQSYTAFIDKYNGINKMLSNARKNNDTVIINGLENDKEKLKEETIGFQRNFIKKYITSPIACYILSSQLMYDLNKQELSNLLDSIPDSNRDNRYYFKARKYLSQINDTL